ncbi:MAG: hypothetical protein U9N42_08315, partial [Campylobacterota bacterium]|nr:hypothetical protein [Campylobacterota bacterium]
MSSKTILIKRQNHRTHPCEDARKKELLKRLITQNEGVKTVVVSTNIEDIQDLCEDENITIVNDEMLSKTPELKCELLISYDLPLHVDAYIERVSHTNKDALIVLGKSQESLLYPIETFMKR